MTKKQINEIVHELVYKEVKKYNVYYTDSLLDAFKLIEDFSIRDNVHKWDFSFVKEGNIWTINLINVWENNDEDCYFSSDSLSLGICLAILKANGYK